MNSALAHPTKRNQDAQGSVWAWLTCLGSWELSELQGIFQNSNKQGISHWTVLAGARPPAKGGIVLRILPPSPSMDRVVQMENNGVNSPFPEGKHISAAVNTCDL